MTVNTLPVHFVLVEAEPSVQLTAEAVQNKPPGIASGRSQSVLNTYSLSRETGNNGVTNRVCTNPNLSSVNINRMSDYTPEGETVETAQYEQPIPLEQIIVESEDDSSTSPESRETTAHSYENSKQVQEKLAAPAHLYENSQFRLEMTGNKKKKGQPVPAPRKNVQAGYVDQATYVYQ